MLRIHGMKVAFKDHWSSSWARLNRAPKSTPLFILYPNYLFPIRLNCSYLNRIFCLSKLSAVLRGRSVKYWFTKLPYETLRSTVFLSVNCGFYIVFFCLIRYILCLFDIIWYSWCYFFGLKRKYFGGVSYYGTLIATAAASLLAILIERKQRFLIINILKIITPFYNPSYLV